MLSENMGRNHKVYSRSEENQSLEEIDFFQKKMKWSWIVWDKIRSVGISSENQRNDEGLNKGARKTEFEEFLKLEVSKTSLSAEEDLELERKLQRNSRWKMAK